MNFTLSGKLFDGEPIIKDVSLLIDDLEEGVNLRQDFIIYKSDDNIDIYNRICDHNGGRLCIHNEKIVCPLHGWEFDPASGGYQNIQLVKEKEDFTISEGNIHVNKQINLPKLPNSKVNKELSIEFFSHACLLIKGEDFSFATDPWIEGFAFASGWWLKHKAPLDWVETLNNVDFIYISHSHPDHLNEFTLRSVRKDMNFVFPDFESKSVEKFLLRLGFKNLNPFNFDSYYNFKKTDLYFSILKSGDFRDDSGFYFTYGDFSFLSSVDSNDLNFGRFPENVTVFASSFAAGASGYPLCFDNEDQNSKDKILLRNKAAMKAIVLNNVKKIKPKYFLPYAGFFIESAKRDKYILQNNIKNTLTDIDSLTKNESLELLNIDNFDSFKFLGNQLLNKDIIPRELFSEEPEVFINDSYNDSAIDSGFIHSFFMNSKFHDNLKVFFELTDGDFKKIPNFSFTVDFSSTSPVVAFEEFDWSVVKTLNNSVAIRHLRIQVRKDSFYWVLKNNMPFEDLSIGFQCKIDRFPDIYNVNFWNHFSNTYIA